MGHGMMHAIKRLHQRSGLYCKLRALVLCIAGNATCCALQQITHFSNGGCAARQGLRAAAPRAFKGFQGIGLTLLSVQRGKLARCGAGDLFDALLVGGEEAAAGAAGKPDARIFHKAARLAGVQPREVPRLPPCVGTGLRTHLDAFSESCAHVAGGQPSDALCFVSQDAVCISWLSQMLGCGGGRCGPVSPMVHSQCHSA